MAMVFVSAIASSLKLTLDKIVDDELSGNEGRAIFKKWMKVSPMEDNYEDDLEMGGPGLASEKTEGAEMATGTIKEGALTRYIARTFALKLIITDEAIEDAKYPQVIEAAMRLDRAMWKTADIDATNVLARATNASFIGGDGVSLASASHTLPQGGTYSNTMATPASPSRVAVSILVSQMRKVPGHDGVTEGVEPKCVVCPTEQWYIWDGLTMSAKAPEPGAFNEINVVNRLNLDVYPIKYWTNTTTNWGIVSDAPNGFRWKWRRRPRGKSWLDNDQEIKKFGISARWARGWSDPRGFFFSNS